MKAIMRWKKYGLGLLVMALLAGTLAGGCSSDQVAGGSTPASGIQSAEPIVSQTAPGTSAQTRPLQTTTPGTVKNEPQLPKIDPLTEEKKQEIEAAWLADQGKLLEWGEFRVQYYGSYGDCIVLFSPFVVSPDVLTTIEVAGYEFVYGSWFSIYAYRDGTFLDLKDAYEKGYLTEEQIAFMVDYHDEVNYKPRKIPPVFGIDPPDEDTVLDLQSEWRHKFGEYFHWGNNLVRYYGTYGDVIVLFDCSGERLAAVTELEVAGSKFVFGSSFSIYVYTGEYIDLEKAYQNGLLTEAQIAEIAEYHRIYEENRMAE